MNTYFRFKTVSNENISLVVFFGKIRYQKNSRSACFTRSQLSSDTPLWLLRHLSNSREAIQHCSPIRFVFVVLRSINYPFLSLSLFQGMIYIHNSKLSFHGRLKSSNSLVDNRWMLKITDYGVARFQGSEETNTLEEQQIYKSTYSRDPIFRHTLEPRIVVFNSESVLIPKPV